jgi:hypothetical protein
VITIQERDRTPRSEYVIVGMGREHQNGLVVQFFEARFLRLS